MQERQRQNGGMNEQFGVVDGEAVPPGAEE